MLDTFILKHAHLTDQCNGNTVVSILYECLFAMITVNRYIGGVFAY